MCILLLMGRILDICSLNLLILLYKPVYSLIIDLLYLSITEKSVLKSPIMSIYVSVSLRSC